MIRNKLIPAMVLCVLSHASSGTSAPEPKIAQAAPTHLVQALDRVDIQGVSAAPRTISGSLVGESRSDMAGIDPALVQFKRTESQFILIWIFGVLAFCGIILAFNARRQD